jgi:Rod binding domain-containing protein
MVSDIGVGAAVSAMQAQSGRLLAQAEAGASSKQDAKIDKAAQDFESILLTGWLQKAESSFGSVPGGVGDDDEDGDPGKSQLQAIAVQALGGALAASGGIGIARMIAEHLKAQSAKAQSGSIPGEMPGSTSGTEGGAQSSALPPSLRGAGAPRGGAAAFREGKQQ